MIRDFIWIVLLAAIDHLTQALAKIYLYMQLPVKVFGNIFKLTYRTNNGIVFGLLREIQIMDQF